MKKSGHSLLAVLGLALGTACVLFALLYVREELGYDRFHAKADRIYRISQALTPPSGEVVNTVFTQVVMGPTLPKEFPEMAEVARLMPWFEGAVPGKVAVRYLQEKGQEKQSYEWFAWADGSLPRIFDLPLTAGDPATVLEAPNSVVLSEPIARKFFGDEPAVGKVLKIDSGYSDENYRVTGVMKELPSNSHFHLHVLASFSSLDHVTDPRLIRDNWWANDAYTYFLLAEGATAEQIEKKLPAFVDKYYPKVPGASAAIHLQRLRDIHLHSDQFGEIEPGGDPRNVKIAAAVALFLLLISCLTFVVLTAPRPSFRRALTSAAIATAIAVVLVVAGLPLFNSVLGKRMALPFAPSSLLVLAAVVLVAAAAAASPLQRAMAGANARRVLVAVALAVALALLAGAGIVRDQIRHMRSQDLGFNKDDVLVVPIRDNRLRDDFAGLKAAMARDPNILGTTFSSVLPSRDLPQMGANFDGKPELELMDVLMTDADFSRVFQLRLLAGRELTHDETDRKTAFLLNRSALAQLRLRSPQEAIGKPTVWNGIKTGSVVGVVEDFHFQPLQHSIEPLLMHIRPLVFRYMYVRFAPGSAEAAIRHLETTWKGMISDKPLEHFLLSDEFARAYDGEERLLRLTAAGAVIALVFAVLGLLGLAAAPGRRTAGRAVSFGEAVRSAWKEPVVLVVLAAVVAFPAVLWVMKRWLQGFAYQAETAPLGFVLAGLAALVVACLAAGWGAVRAAGAGTEDHQAAEATGLRRAM